MKDIYFISISCPKDYYLNVWWNIDADSAGYPSDKRSTSAYYSCGRKLVTWKTGKARNDL